jgi:DNA-binding CsgD family transcriptional regulator
MCKYFNKTAFLLPLLFFVNLAIAGTPEEDFDKATELYYNEKNVEAKAIIDKGLEQQNLKNFDKLKYYHYYIYYYIAVKDYNKALSYANYINKEALKTQDLRDDVLADRSYATLYSSNNYYDKAIEYLHKGLNLIKKIPDSKNDEFLLNSQLAIIHSNLGQITKEYKDYTVKSIDYALKTDNANFVVLAYPTLLNYYLSVYLDTNNQKDLDNLIKTAEDNVNYYEKNSSRITNISSVILSYNNLASIINSFPYKNLSKEAKTAKAEMYLGKAFNLLKKYPMPSIELTCNATEAEILMSKGEMNQVEELLLKSFRMSKEIEYAKSYNVKIYIAQLLVQFYENKSDYKTALTYNKEILKLSASQSKSILESRVSFLEALNDTQGKINKIEQLESKNQLQAKQKYYFIGLIILSIFGIIFLIFSLRYKIRNNKQKTELLEAAQQETELTLQLEIEEKARLKAEQELLAIQQEQLQKAALASTLKLEKKNTLINELKSQVDPNVNIKRLLKEDKLTDEEFSKVENISKEVHPYLFKKLNEIAVKKLSNNDLKYAAYIYLNMDNQQITQALNVDIKTVRMTKYRLKQKLGLNRDDDLTGFIQKLDL